MGVKENRQLWLNALRSGEYKQGKFWLCKDDKYCCLGVLCEVYQKHGPGDLNRSENWTGNGKIVTYDSENSGAPDKVCEWAGFKRGSYLRNNEGLINLNDGYLSVGFAEIANRIENHGFLEEIDNVR